MTVILITSQLKSVSYLIHDTGDEILKSLLEKLETSRCVEHGQNYAKGCVRFETTISFSKLRFFQLSCIILDRRAIICENIDLTRESALKMMTT